MELKPTPILEFSLEQQIVFEKYIKGNNIFITGPGGSGKSALIKKIYDHAYHHFKDIHVTALTGCAAVLLNCKAKTLHSWSGIGLGNASLDQLVMKIKKNKYAKNIWRSTDILVVDEVSMFSLKLFETLNFIGKLFVTIHVLLVVFNSFFQEIFINFLQLEIKMILIQPGFVLKVMIGLAFFLKKIKYN